MLRRIDINARDLAAIYRGRVANFPRAIERGLRRIAVLVHRGADGKLSGGGAAWNYPVPRRRGTLARGMYSRSDMAMAEIGNEAPHAWSIHTGQNPRWKSPPATARPFLDDTVKATDHLDILSQEMRGAW